MPSYFQGNEKGRSSEAERLSATAKKSDWASPFLRRYSKSPCRRSGGVNTLIGWQSSRDVGEDFRAVLLADCGFFKVIFVRPKPERESSSDKFSPFMPKCCSSPSSAIRNSRNRSGYRLSIQSKILSSSFLLDPTLSELKSAKIHRRGQLSDAVKDRTSPMRSCFARPDRHSRKFSAERPHFCGARHTVQAGTPPFATSSIRNIVRATTV